MNQPQSIGNAEGPETAPSGGEGDVNAARRYDQAAHDFAEKGGVDHAARKAAPGGAEEARDLERAEEAGRARAREEDPAARASPEKGPAQPRGQG